MTKRSTGTSLFSDKAQRFFRIWAGLLLALLVFSVFAQASDLEIRNIRFFTNQAVPDEPRVMFDLSWKNAWRNSRLLASIRGSPKSRGHTLSLPWCP